MRPAPDFPNAGKTVTRLLISVVFATLAAGAVARGADAFPWMDDLEEARALAAASGAPMLIVFRCEP